MALGPIDNFRLWMARGLIKAAGLPIVSPWVTATFIEPIFRNLVREGYKANGAVFACISALAFSFPEPPAYVYDAGENPIPNHPLRLLLARPNPQMGEAEMKATTVTYMGIGGNAFWHKVRSASGRVVQLWPYHIGQMMPIPGGDDWIQRYEYFPGGQGGTAGQGIPIPVEDIVHFKWPTPDPEQPWIALPPLRSVARETDSDNEMTRYLFALLKNDAVPRTALTLPAGVALKDGQFKRLVEQFKETHGGDRRGGIAVIEGGADIKRIGLDLKELAFDALHMVPEKRISAAFRVPMSVAGIGADPIYANAADARRGFTESTLAPLWVLSEGEINSALTPEFGDDIVVKHDLSRVKALHDDENQKWARVNGAVAGGYLTVNEARHELGKPGVAGGDVFLRGFSVTPEEARPAKGWLPAQRRISAKAATTRRAAVRLGQSLQRIRRDVAKQMEKAVAAYFSDLSARVVSRARKSYVPGNGHGVAVKISAGDLLTSSDGKELETIVKRFYVEVLKASWETWNTALGVEAAFDLKDPAVAEVLKGAGERIKDINDTTMTALQDLLRFASDEGWSVDQIVRGTEDQPGLRSIVEETYANRARTIARTELGDAQNATTTARYGNAGVEKVLVLDNGDEDDDEECKQLNGTIQTLEWAESNRLEHPNCTRAFAPHFD